MKMHELYGVTTQHIFIKENDTLIEYNAPSKFDYLRIDKIESKKYPNYGNVFEVTLRH